MIGPMPMDDPFESPFAMPDGRNTAAMAAWQERQRRQRTVRLLMMFLMMLLLMDGEEPNRKRRNDASLRGRKRGSKYWRSEKKLIQLDEDVYVQRLDEDEKVHDAALRHSRWDRLIDLNGGADVQKDVRKWADQYVAKEKKRDEINAMVERLNESAKYLAKKGGKGPVLSTITVVSNEDEDEEEEKKIVYHYPRNATGYYRGEWHRVEDDERVAINEDHGKLEKVKGKGKNKPERMKSGENGNESDGEANAVQGSWSQPMKLVTFDDVEPFMENTLKKQKEQVGVYLLPPDTFLDASAITEKNSTSSEGETLFPPREPVVGRIGGSTSSGSSHLRPASGKEEKPSLTLSQNSGRTAFQLYARPIPAMSELSLIDGFVKLYDGKGNAGFASRRTDVLLRVRGVVVHSIGRISLVSTSGNLAGRRRSVLAIRKSNEEDDRKEDGSKDDDDDEEEEEESEERRRLESTLSELLTQQTESGESGVSSGTSKKGLLEEIRDSALSLYLDEFGGRPFGDYHSSTDGEGDERSPGDGWVLQSFDDEASFEDKLRVDESNSGRVLHNNIASWRWPMMSSFRRRLREVDEESARAAEEDSLVQSHDDGKSLGLTSEPVGENKALVTDGNSAPDGDEQDDDDDEEDDDDDDADLFTLYDDRDIDDEKKGDSDVSEKSNVEKVATVQRDTSAVNRDSSKAKRTRRNDKKAKTSSKSLEHSQYLYPYPYVCDDAEEALKKTSTPVSRRIPPREQALEANAAGCEFELRFDIKETKWTVGEWRKSMERQISYTLALDPRKKEDSKDGNDEDLKPKAQQKSTTTIPPTMIKRGPKPPVKDAMVMSLIGTIDSPNCDFSSFVNVTAIRTDWEHTTGKAINYSFYMMLTCLTQIVVLLRQLLHTQAQSAATRVSLLCIGWQTVLDAILCIGHIFLCLVMQPLFTAFASVAFFKLLIFCVIEMKYMAIIIQARNNANNAGMTAEELRRQITVLHLRFYVCLFFAITAFWYVGQNNRTLYVLVLYSFWVPQIIQNVITEAKRPLHNSYIYGMSATRLVAPLYIFAVPNNFLKEVNPDFPTSPFMCELLLLWVGLQTATLIAQGKYGARFMIPARFLPPKFDYSRPIPPSLLPQPTATESGNDNTSFLTNDGTPERSTNGDVRNRIKGNRSRASSRVLEESNGTTTVADTSSSRGSAQTLDCVICYNAIDVNNRRGYMLAPCDHIFHRACLEQWMEVKMECPICRTELPAL